MSVPARKTILGLALGACLVLGVSSAQAANLAPNPGFEDPCGAMPVVPCMWSAGGGAQIVQDTSLGNQHSGSASLALSSHGAVFTGAFSTCFSVSASTVYNLAAWYKTSAAAVTPILLRLVAWSNANCTGSGIAPDGAFVDSPVTGAWTLMTAQTTVPSGMVSAYVEIDFECGDQVACPTDTTVNFDDVVAQTEPLAVTVASLAARHDPHGVIVRWHTGTEADLLGFQVYRSRGGSWQRLTRSLIAAKGSVSGHSYRFLDPTAKRGVPYRYRIKAVNRDGTANWFGPVRLT